MKNKGLLTYSVLCAALFLQPVFGEEAPLSGEREVTLEAAPAVEKDLKAERRAEKIKRHFENLSFRIKAEDADTGDLPETGFSVEQKNEDLENLFAGGEKGRKYLLALLKEIKSGYTKERILRHLARETAEKEADEQTLDTLYSVIKDKSSQVRFLTVRLLGETGSSLSIPKINSLLYDPFILRKDVYPVRQAAREAIDLIKLREEARVLPEEERVKKWLLVIKEKAALRQDYFCEKAVKEIALLPAGKESVWTETLTAQEMVGKKTLINNKIFGYLLLAAASLQEERTLPLIKAALEESSLLYMAVRSSALLSLTTAMDLLLDEPVNSEKAALFLSAIKEKLSKTDSLNPAGEETAYAGYAKEKFDTVVNNVKLLLLFKRDREVYIEAARLYAFALNDYARALEYCLLYEKALGEAPVEESYLFFKAALLANKGRYFEAVEADPLINLKPFLINQGFAETLQKNKKSDTVTEARKNYLLVNVFLEGQNYRKALDILKKPEESVVLELPGKFVRQKTVFAEEKLKAGTEEILAVIDFVPKEGLSLEISTEKKEYAKEEGIKVKIKLSNSGTETAYGVNPSAGVSGFDLLLMQSGRLVKKLKQDLAPVSRSVEETAGDVFEIEVGGAFSSEILLVAAKEDKIAGELEIILSYAGGPEAAETGKGWIKQTLISNELKIKIRK
ncbi:MAG: HEAT repeat domain-containing protein [Candidatus Firestonebacteria bacterium]